MSKKVKVQAEVCLEYWRGKDIAGRVYQNMPVEAEHTSELVIAIKSDSGESDPRARVFEGTPQIHFAGTARALEAFGRYLIALARLETKDTDVHEHFEDVQNDDGGTVHLIVRRVGG